MHFRHSHAGLSIALCVLFASCRLVDPHSPTDVTLEVDSGEYFAGQTVNVTIANSTGRTIQYNLCYAYLERQEGGDWIRVEKEDTCDEITFALEHGQRATYEYLLDEAIPADTYRLVYSFSPVGDDELTIATNTFDVSRS